MILWRIAAETRNYKAEDLSGAGAAKNPGRWNEAGQAVVYAAPSISLAVLETAAHVDDAGLPLNRYVVRIEVPPGVWRSRIELDPATLPPTWNAIPSGSTSAQVGSSWLKGVQSALLLVPSVIVPEERVVLINPLHSLASKISSRVERLFDYNRLFRS